MTSTLTLVLKSLPREAFLLSDTIPLMSTHSNTSQFSSANVDPAELAKFSELAHRWWDTESEFKPLHQINPLRLNWIQTLAPLKGKKGNNSPSFFRENRTNNENENKCFYTTSFKKVHFPNCSFWHNLAYRKNCSQQDCTKSHCKR
jgi:hypothetical protein